MTTRRKLNYDTSLYQRILFDRRKNQGSLKTALDAFTASMCARANINTSTPRGRAMAAEIRADVEDVAAETFARAYSDPPKLDAPTGEVAWAGGYDGILDGLPEWQSARASTRGDPDLAALATASMLQGVKGECETLVQAGKNAQDDTNRDVVAVRIAMRGAAEGAYLAGLQMRAAMNTLFPGMGAPPPQWQHEDPRRMLLAERLVSDRRVSAVLEVAGRISRISAKARSVRSPFVRQEVVDLEYGNDLGRILPSELMKLGDPVLAKTAAVNFVEGRMLQYKMGGKEVLGRGPIVLLVDRSGSMIGMDEQYASAMAIATIGQGSKDDRNVVVIEFDDGIVRETQVRKKKARVTERGGKTVDTTVAEAALRIASTRSDNGTSFDGVFRLALEYLEVEPRADFLFVTDGLASVSSSVMRRIERAKRADLRIFGLTTGGGSLSPAVRAICDVAVDLDREDDAGAAIALALAAATTPDSEPADTP